MEQVLHKLHWKTLLLYLDDVIVISPDFTSHLQILEDVLERLQDARLKLKLTKCKLLQDKVYFLGHVVGAEGVDTDLDKVAATREWEARKDLQALQAFLGMAGYYQQYIPDFALIAKPLTRLTSGNNPLGVEHGGTDSFSETETWACVCSRSRLSQPKKCHKSLIRMRALWA